MTQDPAHDPWEGLKPSGGQFQKWNEPGDRVFGVVTEKSTGRTIDGEPCPQLVIRLHDGGDEITVTAAQAALKNQLLRERPQVGDTVDIEFTGIDTTGGRTLKLFSVAVAPGEEF